MYYVAACLRTLQVGFCSLFKFWDTGFTAAWMKDWLGCLGRW
jgi:hypothetical protein